MSEETKNQRTENLKEQFVNKSMNTREWLLIGLLSMLYGSGFQFVGQLAILGAACSYAFAAIYGRRFKGMPPVVVAAGMLAGTTIMMLPCAFIFEKPYLL